MAGIKIGPTPPFSPNPKPNLTQAWELKKTPTFKIPLKNQILNK